MRLSPLRQRMIDMTARHFGEKTQKVCCVKNLAVFIGRAPETATAEELAPLGRTAKLSICRHKRAHSLSV